MTSSEHLFDKRIIQRNIAKGLVDSKEYDKHIKQLKDLENESEKIHVAFEDEADAGEE